MPVTTDRTDLASIFDRCARDVFPLGSPPNPFEHRSDSILSPRAARLTISGALDRFSRLQVDSCPRSPTSEIEVGAYLHRSGSERRVIRRILTYPEVADERFSQWSLIGASIYRVWDAVRPLAPGLLSRQIERERALRSREASREMIAARSEQIYREIIATQRSSAVAGSPRQYSYASPSGASRSWWVFINRDGHYRSAVGTVTTTQPDTETYTHLFTTSSYASTEDALRELFMSLASNEAEEEVRREEYIEPYTPLSMNFVRNVAAIYSDENASVEAPR